MAGVVADEHHVTALPGRPVGYLELQHVVARHGVPSPHGPAPVEGPVAPAKFGECLLHQDGPQLVAVGLHVRGGLRPLVHREVVVNRDPDPHPRAAVPQAHGILAPVVVLGVFEAVADGTLVLRHPRHRRHQPAVAHGTLAQVRGLNVTFEQVDVHALGHAIELVRAHPLHLRRHLRGCAVLSVAQRLLSSPLLVLEIIPPHRFAQAAAQGANDAAEEAHEIDAEARQEVHDDGVVHEHKRQQEASP
mmetsp:Transcript_23284/g.37315  ORF Transcript_23284/g.37315 Transcript_23284/m.37315 type:complete len:247 (+) Transcript_23284:1075-1815(+)